MQSPARRLPQHNRGRDSEFFPRCNAHRHRLDQERQPSELIQERVGAGHSRGEQTRRRLRSNMPRRGPSRRDPDRDQCQWLPRKGFEPAPNRFVCTLVGLAAHVAEWKNGNGRLCRHAKRRSGRRSGLHRLFILDVHRGDETKPFLGERPNEALLLAAIANGLAHRIYSAGQSRFRNNPSAPNGGDEVVLADNTVAIFDQINQHIEDLRFEGDELIAASQLAPVGVQQAFFESYLHVGFLFELGPKRLQIRRSVFAEEASYFIEAQRRPDAPRFSQGALSFRLVAQLCEDPRSNDTRRIETTIPPRGGRRLRQRLLEASRASEGKSENHAPEGQPKIPRARPHAEFHALNAFIKTAEKNQ